MGIISACLALLITVFLLWKLPIWQLRDKKQYLKLENFLELENEYRKTIAQIIGGIFVLMGLAFTWYQISATQESIIISRETLITDRYSKAIDQLGESNQQTRLGGIYALGKIAEQSKEYVSTVDNVLASYIRQSDTNNQLLLFRDEIQAVITIIASKKTHVLLDTNNNYPVSLANIQGLKNFKFYKGTLIGGNLSNTNFSNSNFAYTNLSKITALHSTFTNCNFTNAILISAQLEGANLSNAILKGVNLTGSSLRISNLKEADCTECDLSEANLSEANLESTILYGANLTTAKGLTAEQLSKAKINKETKLPSFKK